MHKKYGLELYNLAMKKHIFALVCATLLSAPSIVSAAPESNNSSISNISFFATVNNTMLTKGLLDLNIKAAIALSLIHI